MRSLAVPVAGKSASMTQTLPVSNPCVGHLRLDLHSFLPRFALIDTARDNDAKRAHEVCVAIREGEIVLFDKVYVDFAHLHDLNERGVLWVTRAKDNLQYKVVQRRLKPVLCTDGTPMRDAWVTEFPVQRDTPIGAWFLGLQTKRRPGSVCVSSVAMKSFRLKGFPKTGRSIPGTAGRPAGG